MLRSLEIQNFKGIKQGKLDDLAQVNILVGRNNSGKSTVLDALVMMRCAVVGLDLLDAHGLEQIVKRRIHRGEVDFDELWYRLDANVPIFLSVQFTGGEQVIEQWDAGLRGTIETKNYISDFVFTNNSLRLFLSSGLRSTLSKELGEAQASYLASIHMVDATSIHVPFAEKLWAGLVLDRKDDTVRRILEEVYGSSINYIRAMRFPKEERLVAALPHAGLAVDWFGDGFRYAVNILSLGVQLRGTALLIEELETHQHPESLRMLIATLFELAKQQELQLFLTTHSMELISYALATADDKGIDMKLHHLRLNQEGTLTSTPFTKPNAELMLDIGHDPRLHYKYLGAE